MVHRAPVPAFPAVGIVVDLGVADRVAEAEQRGQVVADIAPGMVRAVRHRHHARAIGALEPLDLAADEVERLVPGDADVTGLAAVLWIALAVGVEVHPLHRLEQPVRRIDDRLGVLPVRRQRRLARRREIEAARADGPGRPVVLAEVDRRHADDLAVLDIDEHRPAVGHVAIARGAVGKPRADLQAGALAHHDGLREPVGEVLGPVDRELEILLRVDLVQPVDRRHQQIGAERRGLECQGDVGVAAQPASRGHLAAMDRVPAADLLVARLELRHEVAILETRVEGRMTPGGVPEQLRHSPEDDLEFHDREHGLLLTGLRRWSSAHIFRRSERVRNIKCEGLRRYLRLQPSLPMRAVPAPISKNTDFMYADNMQLQPFRSSAPTSRARSFTKRARSPAGSGASMLLVMRGSLATIFRSMTRPCGVRKSRFVRRSSVPALRTIRPFFSSRSSTLPIVERSKKMRSLTRVASMPGCSWITTRAENCTAVRSNALASVMNTAVDI